LAFPPGGDAVQENAESVFKAILPQTWHPNSQISSKTLKLATGSRLFEDDAIVLEEIAVGREGFIPAPEPDAGFSAPPHIIVTD